VVRLDETIDRDGELRFLNDRGVQSKAYFPPIHLQPFYRERFGSKPGAFPITERISSRTIALPFFSRLTEAEMDYVVTTLVEAVRAVPAREIENG